MWRVALFWSQIACIVNFVAKFNIQRAPTLRRTRVVYQ
jgi:hypothetical protein